jgi:hypothetical protein
MSDAPKVASRRHWSGTKRWLQFLESPRLPWLAALAAGLLCAPSLFGGLATEDYVFRAAARVPLRWSTLNVFGGPEAPAATAADRAQGVLPWLTPDDFHIAFWRPLSSLTHQFDYRMFGATPWLMHLESILLLVALVYVAARLYRRLFDARRVAGLATLFFALDDAHGQAVGWLANRNAILAGLFALSALHCHDHWRRSAWRPGAILAPLALAMSLLSGELGLGALGYFIAYALFLDPGRRRYWACVPAAAVTFVWAVEYRALGYGARGSGLYLDPLREPLVFLRSLPDRLGTLCLGQLALPPSDVWTSLHDAPRTVLPIAGITLLAGLAWLVRSANVATRFCLVGGILSLLPVCAAFPSDRLLVLGGLGLFGAVASVSFDLRRFIRVPLIAVHLVFAPLALPVRSLTMARYHARVSQLSSSAYANVRSPDETLVLLTAPDYFEVSLIWFLHVYDAGAPPTPLLTLAGTRDPVELRRVDANTLEVGVPRGFLAEPFDRIYRSPSRPFVKGDRIRLPRVEVEVTEVSASGEPRAATFRFIWPLDSGKLRFVALRGDRYVLVEPPGVEGAARQ